MSKSNPFNHTSFFGSTQAASRFPKAEADLLNELYAAREDERRRVARELHDDLSQRVALLSIEAAEASSRVPPGFRDLARHCRLVESQALALAHDIRQVALQQHPATALVLGLRDALRSLVATYRKKTRVSVNFRARGVRERFDDLTTNHVYRIVEEALRNAARHSGATRVQVRLMGYSYGFRVVVRDFGKGFDPLDCRGLSLGLLNMQERARLVNGKFSIASRQGFGTCISLDVPLINRRS